MAEMQMAIHVTVGGCLGESQKLQGQVVAMIRIPILNTSTEYLIST